MDENPPTNQNEPQTNTAPTGITVLGIVNILLMGLIPLSGAIIYLKLYYTLPPQEFNTKILALFNLPQEYLAAAAKVISKALLVQVVISLAFIVSGAGILARQEWARKMVLFMSMGMIIFGLILVVFNSNLIVPVIAQIIYPAALVLYFSDRKVAQNFSLR